MSFKFLKIKLSRSTWFSLGITLLLVTAIGFTQYAALTSRDNRSNAAATGLFITQGCQGNAPYVNFAWSSSGASDYWVDVIRTDLFDNWNTYWNKNVTNSPARWSATEPFSGGAVPENARSYVWRVWDGVDYAYAPTFTTQNCAPAYSQSTYYSQGSYCTNSAPSKPSLTSPTSPANGSSQTATTASLDWSTPSSWGTNCAGNSNQYLVFLEKDDNTPDVQVNQTTSTLYNASGLTVGTYYWRVQAANGALATYSDTWSFTVQNVYSQSTYGPVYSQGTYAPVYSQGTYAVTQPDLVVSNFALSDTSATPGQTLTATINVTNSGNGAANTFWVDVFQNQGSNAPCGNPNGQASRSFSSLAAGASTGSFTLNFTAPSSAGTYTARLFADADCQIAESSEANNQTTVSYTVSSAGTGGTYSQSSYAPGYAQSAYTGSTGSKPSTSQKVSTPGTSAPAAGSTDIALTFAANPVLKGGMEITMQIDGTSVSQKAVVDNKGGSFNLKTSGLTAGKAYTLKVFSKNSLVQAININFSNATTANVAAFTLGDFNADNVIDNTDYDRMVPLGMSNQDSLYDVNYDGVVNSVDYSILLINLGKKG